MAHFGISFVANVMQDTFVMFVSLFVSLTKTVTTKPAFTSGIRLITPVDILTRIVFLVQVNGGKDAVVMPILLLRDVEAISNKEEKKETGNVGGRKEFMAFRKIGDRMKDELRGREIGDRDVVLVIGHVGESILDVVIMVAVMRRSYIHCDETLVICSVSNSLGSVLLLLLLLYCYDIISIRFFVDSFNSNANRLFE